MKTSLILRCAKTFQVQEDKIDGIPLLVFKSLSDGGLEYL